MIIVMCDFCGAEIHGKDGYGITPRSWAPAAPPRRHLCEKCFKVHILHIANESEGDDED